jgi:uncharacterized protein (TIGR00369 family)
MNEAQMMNDTQTVTRSRTFSWSDPAVTAARIGGRSGLELLQAIAAGEVPGPPAMHLLDVDNHVEAEEGRFTLTMTAQEFHYNPLGTVHGGILATLLDTATGCAVHSTLPAGWGYTSLDLTTKFLRPATLASGTLRAEGTVISRGRTTALAEARLTDARDRLIAHATSTCLLFEIDAGKLSAAEGPPSR